ncbi:hypothetical protein PO768_06390 [Paucibacter sp. XJ19-41]|nr:hypothetical protein [Paucibacter sp. XJ19-41]MDC6167070.1 hypothetical protein [Paucibacter sp. XJ19-41]
MQQGILELEASLFMKQAWVQFGLLGPQQIKLLLDHGPVDIEVVALVDASLAVLARDALLTVSCPHGLTLFGAPREPFAHRAAALIAQGLAQLADGCLQRAAVVVLLVGLAVALEAAALIDVEQRASELLGRQRAVKALGP